ncbi:MAG: hypothetical protein WC444_07255 [Candidatus Paceibacterota bacterium]
MINFSKIADFVMSYTMYRDREKIEEYIRLHACYKTLMLFYDSKDNIISFCRWNIESKDTANVLDLVIRPQYRNVGLLKIMLEKGIKMYPNTKYITFDRMLKYPQRKSRKYSVDRLLHKQLQEA